MSSLPSEQQTDRPEAAVARVVTAPAGGGDSGVLRSLGKYRIVHKIGAGGMGAVYLAQDSELNRSVALKVLPKVKAENPILIMRFKAEAQAAAQLAHDNIVTLYEAGEADGHLYIAMEFIDGVDAFDLVQREGKVPVRRSLEIIRQAARALQHAYEQGIVHRDIKPSNLLIRRDGVVKLADMGLARSIDEAADAGLTQAGTTVGTVDYMSPEQGRNSKSADTRSDIYSLGCTWYHMLTGCAPYQGDCIASKLTAHAMNALPDPRRKNPAIPETVIAVMHRMMAKSPQDRYQTPAELLQDLQCTTLSRDDVTDETLMALSQADAGNRPVNAQKPGGVRAGAKAGPRRPGNRAPEGSRPALPNVPKVQRSQAVPKVSAAGIRKSAVTPVTEAKDRPRPQPSRPSTSVSTVKSLPRLVGTSPSQRRAKASGRYGWTHAVGGVLLGSVFILVAWLLSALFSTPSEVPSVDASPNPFAASPAD